MTQRHHARTDSAGRRAGGRAGRRVRAGLLDAADRLTAGCRTLTCMGLFAQWRGTVLARGISCSARWAGPTSPDDPSEPAPSLNRLDALVEGFTAGQPVRWTMAGQPRPLPGPVDVVAYRIIEEALTNACRHAPGAPVGVRLRYDAAGITIEVRDEGAGPAAVRRRHPGAGRGLLGVRRRAPSGSAARSPPAHAPVAASPYGLSCPRPRK